MFEKNFAEAQAIITCMSGYISHDLQRCVELANRYVLLVEWQSIEDHSIGFLKSPQYQQWCDRLHHFFEEAPIVEHYQSL
ncbi:UNVERIFIED_CONTAM: hypothetical protein GTU68_051844 [Idotea baltica]|nr:hypothetical protein [Idotea baltica]